MARVKLRCIIGSLGLKTSYQEKGLLRFTPHKAGQQLRGKELQEKEAQKD